MIRHSVEAARAARWLSFAAATLLSVAAFDASAAGAAASSAPAASAPAETTARWVHAYAAFGEPKYGPDFKHFDYVNPDAPKGGTLHLRNPDRRQNFDKYNYYTIRGNAPAGMGIFMYETLTILGADEPRTMYGLLAQEMKVEPDLSAITFRLNPKARFSNGDPVTAADVKYSFDSLSGKYASPTYSSALSGVRKAVVIDERTIRFEMAERSSDALFQVGGLPVFSHKWGSRPDGTHTRFDEIIDEMPITSGPYTIAQADSGRRIDFVRNPDYWAKDLPVRRGFFNFDHVVYRYYQDEAVATEAFKAGEFDLVRVYGSGVWMRQHKGPKWDDGRIVKQAFRYGTGQGLQAYMLNLRRPLFQDIRVRKALVLTYDFETNNRYRLLKRANSEFNNSDFAAQGLPSAGELALLEPFRKDLPKEVFGPAFVAPRTDSSPNALRRNLLEARALLEAAGWKLAPDGRLRNAKGEAFEFEYLAPGDSVSDARIKAWQRNLDKLGITLKSRNVDFALYSRRLEEYDFDVVTIAGASFGLPSPAIYLAIYGSKSADEKGNNNFRGVKSKAVDAMIEAMNTAKTLEQFRDATRALDRIVMWSYWQVPELYADYEPISYWNKFGMPAKPPLYFTADLAPDVDWQLPWPLVTWWMKDTPKH
ncbi:MAG: ABC transporter substrate-binding protein [Burkholderiaceae bacterium]|nr:ABC transporter substrate-binding protein [Burkholderiaceae bacterium]